MLRSFLFLLMCALLFSCNYPDEGSLGGWAFITFPIQKDKFKLAVDSFRNAHPENEIPERWQYDSEYWKGDSAIGIREGEVLYLKKDHEEMYFFSYIPIDDNHNETSTTIALRSVFRNGTWYRKAVLDPTEQRSISMRFYQNIIAELELITNVKSISENEAYEQPENDHKDSGNKSYFALTVVSNNNRGIKKELSIKEKADSVAAILMYGKFDVSTVHELEKICAKSKSEDLTMQFFTTTVEELFYNHMASFTNYYMANPGSCLRGKLKQSMEEYMSVYAPKDRMKKHVEKENRVLKRAERENFSPKQLAYLHTLFNSISLQ
ncbi:MAG: hypothetical protein P0Y49_10135 [Candidatus Pedobacter colombiensis]|uniref:Lipoprotein n=1 Tax=Candidatus Pedobacter colombiensis TaxID=3121371 RepID=A0AAJ6B8L5_9SPHI|nr:hypothetical protein [Pedobacter sp.]WEK21495.1 MAG: hypothetical protein P0Y49_10135 [Pedobacter sp.]